MSSLTAAVQWKIKRNILNLLLVVLSDWGVNVRVVMSWVGNIRVRIFRVSKRDFSHVYSFKNCYKMKFHHYYPKNKATYTNVKYRQTSNIRYSLVCNKTVDHSDVVGAPPAGAAPTTSSLAT